MTAQERGTLDGIPAPVQRGTRGTEQNSSAGSGMRQLNTQDFVSLWMPHSNVASRWVVGNGWQEVTRTWSNLDDIPQIFLERNLRQYSIRRLALCVHGAFQGGSPSGVDLNGSQLNAASINAPNNLRSLQSIRLYLTANAVVTFYACASAFGSQGQAFLTGLSNQWPNRTVIGFITSGYFYAGASNNAAGNIVDTLQVTDPLNPPGPNYPRFTDNRPSARHARNGLIVREFDRRALWNDFSRVLASSTPLRRRSLQPHTTGTETDEQAYYRAKLQLGSGAW